MQCKSVFKVGIDLIIAEYTAPHKVLFQPKSNDILLISLQKYMLWVLIKSAYCIFFVREIIIIIIIKYDANSPS